uniref:Uncharacterized protein n=1 Tax=Phaeomonas parva TaxID=124430 RepID=A0A7S1XQK1_9STRA|mmetsp:Transcript_29781/g.95272  ORF Transcript_29781/g.95272 Transcript_29781/m.95272 type:complete len:156 (+) Transcript_29781:99-566(+)
MGNPIQSVALSGIEALQRTTSVLRAMPGTAFFDAGLNQATKTGVIGKGTVQRYNIIVMGGIAAEAMVFGDAEGGREDERTLVEFLLLQVAPHRRRRFLTREEIAGEARWSAANAIALLRKHRRMYDRLVAKLKKDRGRSLGDCILAMEGVKIDDA